MAMDAVQLFRRDEMKFLYPAHDIRSVHIGDLYFVPDEEEKLIADAGYDLDNFEVTPDFLIHLLYPERVGHSGLSENP
ncbi:GL16642 [Drosophila persimilis]|uniref:GL16642 n=1 Tax=Drosophila persimilis TaxID=7234 RepID=B4HCI2_DROPE|nr:GL16642 [Drosophila persimilis]